jgi:hypothetical protein
MAVRGLGVVAIDVQKNSSYFDGSIIEKPPQKIKGFTSSYERGFFEGLSYLL